MPIGKLDHYSIRTLDIERERTVPVLGLYQVFLADPSQATIELNFPAHEA